MGLVRTELGMEYWGSFFLDHQKLETNSYIHIWQISWTCGLLPSYCLCWFDPILDTWPMWVPAVFTIDIALGMLAPSAGHTQFCCLWAKQISSSWNSPAPTPWQAYCSERYLPRALEVWETVTVLRHAQVEIYFHSFKMEVLITLLEEQFWVWGKPRALQSLGLYRSEKKTSGSRGGATSCPQAQDNHISVLFTVDEVSGPLRAEFLCPSELHSFGGLSCYLHFTVWQHLTL